MKCVCRVPKIVFVTVGGDCREEKFSGYGDVSQVAVHLAESVPRVRHTSFMPHGNEGGETLLEAVARRFEPS